jgi:hypothetical protein
MNTLVNTTIYNRSELLVIQVCVGLFKVVWNSFFVPWSCDWLASFSSHRRSMQSRYLMSVINYLRAPVVSTIVYNESYFYFVFNSAEQVSSTNILVIKTVELCSGLNTTSVNECSETLPVDIGDSTSSFRFLYSYACESALIVAYIPVLMSSSLIYGLFQQIIRIVLLFDSTLSRLVKSAYNIQKLNMIKSEIDYVIHVPGRDIIVRLIEGY